MRGALFLLIFLKSFCFAVDFDVAVIGTSPISLLEALYHYHLGHRVIVLEEANEMGGAWKSIDICGISHVDLGCHQLGSDREMLQFLEDYLGCQMVSLDKPELKFDEAYSPTGFYFSAGCYEMVNNLIQMIQATDMIVMLGCQFKKIEMDQEFAIINTKNDRFTVSKIIITPHSKIKIGNEASEDCFSLKEKKFYHLYFLIEDSTPYRFTYKCSSIEGVSRMMNLSPFIQLETTGQQLIVLQLWDEKFLGFGPQFFEQLKEEGFLDERARLLTIEPYIFQQSQCDLSFLQKIKNASNFFEVLGTMPLENNIVSSIPKWKQSLPLFIQNK